MEYRYHAYDPNHFATNLRYNRGMAALMWDSARGQDALIVQTPFKHSAALIMEELCRKMSGMSIRKDEFTEVLPDVWVRFMSAADKTRLGGCPIHSEASTYTVFACIHEDDGCVVYAQPEQRQMMISDSCNIPMEIRISIAMHTIVRGIGPWRREMPTGYYMMSFPDGLADKFRDGDLYYKVGDSFEIPVTRRMVEQGTVYVKTDCAPSMVSRTPGLTLLT